MSAVHAAVRPGEGVVARFGSYLLVVLPPVDPAAAAAVVDIVRSGAADDAGGQALVQRVAAHLAATDDDPTLAVIGPGDDGGWVALVRGPATLRAEGPEGIVELAGAGRPTWADGYLPAAAAIDVRADGDEGGDPGLDFDLVEGVVPGSGLTLRGAAAPVRAPEPEPDDDDADGAPADEPEAADDAEQPDEQPDEGGDDDAAPPDDDAGEDDAEQPDEDGDEDEQPDEAERADVPPVPSFVSIDLSNTGDVTARDPLPVQRPDAPPEPVGEGEELVTGINCKRGHFNHPQAAFCALCGISMLQQTQNPVQGPRPPLGILVFADGTTLSVDGSYVVGREPDRDPDVAGGTVRPHALTDPDQVLSRVHLRIGPTGWDVFVTDRGSANGTYVRTEGGTWERIEADTPHRLDSGMQVRLGNHQFVYEAHHRARSA